MTLLERMTSGMTTDMYECLEDSHPRDRVIRMVEMETNRNFFNFWTIFGRTPFQALKNSNEQVTSKIL